MTQQNPYSAPASDLAPEVDEGEFPLHEPRSVSAGQGWQWIADGFDYFKSDAGTWIGICVIGFVIMVVTGLIPIVNFLVSFTSFIWLGGLMLGCKAQHDGEPLKIGHLFAGFSESLLPLLGLSAIFFIAIIVVVGAAIGTVGMSMLGGMSGEGGFAGDPATLLLPVMIALALIMPLYMLVWFAPALIVLHKVPVFKAMGMSFKACLKNIIPFLIYGVILLVLMIVATIPLGLGFLVLGPVMFAAMFVSYKDIFVD